MSAHSLTPLPTFTRRRMLAFVSDRGVCEQLHAAFVPYGFEVATAEVEDGAAVARDFAPSVAFIWVDVRNRAGFALCNQLKREHGASLPIVLISSGISRRELVSHRRLRGRADAYVDRSSADQAALVRAVSQIVDLDVTPRPTANVIELFSAPRVEEETATYQLEDTHVGDDPAQEQETVEESIDEPVEQTLVPPSGDTSVDTLAAPDAPSSEALAELCEENERRQELRDARAFNAEAALAREGEFVAMRQRVAELDADNQKLGALLDDTHARLVERERTVTELAHSSRLLHDNLEQAEDELEQVRIALARLEAEAQAAAAAAAETLDRRRAEHSIELAALRADHEDEVDRLRAEHEAELEALHVAHEEETEVRLAQRDREHTAALATLEAQYERHLEASDQRGAAAVAAQYLLFCRSMRPR